MSRSVFLSPLAARLLRAAHLEAVELTGTGWRVSGGRSTHLVTEAGCDCPDHTIRSCPCKHMLAVDLTSCPPVVRHAVRELANELGGGG